MAKASADRWQSAQSYERGFWERQAEAVAQDSDDGITWYDWRAQNVVESLRSAGLGHLTEGDASLLEVGSGPVGVVAHLRGKLRVAVDPLGDFYGEKAELAANRDPAVTYLAGVGEALDAADDTFDLAIIENCIDHVQDTDAVMQELLRVLRPDGTLYLTVNIRTWWGYWVHRVLSRLRIDMGHPHTFRASTLRKLLKQNNFQLVSLSGGSMAEAWWAQITNSGWRERLKGLVGVTESEVYVVARATPAGK